MNLIIEIDNIAMEQVNIIKNVFRILVFVFMIKLAAVGYN